MQRFSTMTKLMKIFSVPFLQARILCKDPYPIPSLSADLQGYGTKIQQTGRTKYMLGFDRNIFIFPKKLNYFLVNTKMVGTPNHIFCET
jgi:hypothetical protein